MNVTPAVTSVAVTGGAGPAGADGAAGANGAAGTGSASIVEAQLNANAAIGATTLTLDRNVPAGWTAGRLVAIGVGTSSCEIRKITSSSTVTLTLSTALKNAHSTSAVVMLTGFWVPIELWGAQAGVPLTDSFRSLIGALTDQAVQGFGLEGRGPGLANAYYTSHPLTIGDYQPIRNLSIVAKSPFGIDCTIGTYDGIPTQYLVSLAGQVGTATFDATTDIVTVSGSPGGQYSDVQFFAKPGSTMPGGIEEGRRYFTITGSSLTTKISLSSGDPTSVDITSNGSGEIVMVSTGLARLMADSLHLIGNSVKGLNGLIANVQQPSYTPGLRIEGFPVIGASIAGQQASFPNIEITGSWVGLEMAGAEMIYMPGGNIESCDTWIVFAEAARAFGGTGNFDSQIGPGFHFEAPATGALQVQTLIHVTGSPSVNSPLTAGSFQLRFKNVLTAAIQWNDTAATIQGILEAHAAIGAGNVACTQLTGTNLSDGPIRVDFTVGALRWEKWSGSTSTATGGQLAIVSSTITGGPLSISVFNPDGRGISYRSGYNNHIGPAIRASMGGAIPALTATPAFLKAEGSAIGASGFGHGYRITDLEASVPSGLIETPIVDDSYWGIYFTANDSSFFATGISSRINDFIRPSRHGGTRTQPWQFWGDGGRAIRFSSIGRPTLELKAGTAATDDLLASETTALVRQAGFNRNGYPFVAAAVAPTDAELANGELVFYVDTTVGAPKLRFKVKDSAGTVFDLAVTAT